MCFSEIYIFILCFLFYQVYVYIISEFRKDMFFMFGKDNKKKDLIKNLGDVYVRIQRDYQILFGDFLDMKRM